MNQAKVNSNLVNKLRYNFDHKSPRPKRTGGGLKESIGLVKKTLTALIKYERVELNLNRALWTRGYVDRLISEAIKRGPNDPEMMQIADFYILDKPCVHKLFKVLAPRYENYTTSYTKMYKVSMGYPDKWYPRACLELRGNPYPSLEPTKQYDRNLLHNLLLDEARKEYRMEKYKELAENVGAETTQSPPNETIA